MSARPSVAILILNWNGREHLEILLPSIREAVARHPDPVAVVVVDNRSTEPDAEWVRREYPEFEVVIAERNDYLFSLNPVVAARREEVVIILNNDMKVAPDFIAPLLGHFADPRVFAVSASVFDWDSDRRQIGRRTIRMRKWWFDKEDDFRIERPVYTVEAGGGCSAYRRTMFVELGGFDDLYRPGYWEDMDLSYRAWMRGWTSCIEPRSRIWHRHGATLWDRAREHRMIALLNRNGALFMVKNLDGWGFVLGFLAMLPWRIAYHWFVGSRPHARGLIDALPRLGQALRRRLRHRGRPRLAFSEIARFIREASPPSHPPALSSS